MFISQNNVKNLDKKYEWLKNEIEKTQKVIESKGFPCVFGVQGHNKQVHFYSALKYPYSSKELAQDITDYLTNLETMPKKDRGVSGLLVYFEPIGDMNIHAKQFMVWEVLSTMKNEYGNEEDTIDNDPLTDGYSFLFKNELWFINFSSNSYQNRKSRNLGAFITLAMQTLSKSDEYFNSNMKVKAKAQKTVRDLAEKYDGCPVHPGLGPVIGSGKFSPAKLSYFIGDTNEEKSYEPWKFKRFIPKKIIIDDTILQKYSTSIQNFQSLFRRENIENLSDCDNTEYINNMNLLLTNDVTTIEKYRESINIATFDKNLAAYYHVFDIDYFNDLLALRYKINS
ncbi:YqcI/YcgG family protein [Staphylococcus sp. SQ8-PEA]|uniref:YqcI/YcgG family protein n=1 Tax=Staphylococcus marylandisciuri TaxID=2981529 RepID=A0ABT2QNW7_9STAP|nr:YqcI/YcgG family protein [Staphylococcus marylandisciuri]MCU5745658.1 YqcI/YcgG family protein [Staphylococcus marylandisciuri]